MTGAPGICLVVTFDKITMIGIRVGDAEVDIASVMNRGGENGYEANKDNEETRFSLKNVCFVCCWNGACVL